jgi:hypothetical protein
MNRNEKTIFVGDTPVKLTEKKVKGEYVILSGELLYKIHNFDAMEPFFMSIVSSSDHWLFVSSTGGLSAGRVSAEQALFPYYTVDKITENSENTGSKAIFLVLRSGGWRLWEPLSQRQSGLYRLERNIYKNEASTMLLFEEINFDLDVTYRYAWRTSEKFGFVKTTWLVNSGDSACQVEFVDGLQNILPANITELTQITFSPLLDAYKRSELNPETGLAIFGLNSTLTDLAEPSESLLAATAAQLGLDQADYLLSPVQLDRFRSGNGVVTEKEVRGQRGAYFVHTTLELAPGAECTWHLLADVSQDSAAIVRKVKELQGDRIALRQELERDIASNHLNLWRIVASADGLQLSNDQLCAAHHFANVMFNVMRGGIFADQYWINKNDFIDFVSVHNHSILQENDAFFAALPARIHVSDLQARAEASDSAELIRLSYTFLPLTFSRRHGDPSRPWNHFAINIKKPDGSLKLDYEGNWRDIFQNWEALACSYPEFVESMICTFLNATTVDGYNPYRVTLRGVDWEKPEPSNPWANIGYWSDHQIIYLQKLMEISVKMHPGKLQEFLARPVFSYVHVPYRIKPYPDLLANSYNTIEFDWDLERKIETRLPELGTDAKLVVNSNGQILLASLAEKLLTLLLAKLANFVPEGGIWMNTQRPEWNDANNALVGKGLSVVTLCYLRRYIAFCQELFSKSALSAIPLNLEVHKFYTLVYEILVRFQSTLQSSFSNEQRRAIMDALGQAGSDYRWNFYENGFSGEFASLPVAEIVAFLQLAQKYIEQSLRANQRDDHLYHAYNILHLHGNQASITHLYEMLEGQVAILSSGLLSGAESLALLLSLRQSSLYRVDQRSYILYPDRELSGFLEKNSLAQDRVSDLVLFKKLADTQDNTLITRDLESVYHFSGHIHNIRDVSKALEALRNDSRYTDLVIAESERIKALFEETFHHNEFTGRSGTFFAYEGLGSIYWHMVSKLLLAVQETILRVKDEPATKALIERYTDIRKGLSFNKPPDIYGAFPTDPYSHTPKGQGAKQPGMTGLVKEEILTRQAELGLSVENGDLVFEPLLFDRHELLLQPSVFSYLDVSARQQQIELKPGSLAYTICQTPVILQISNEMQIAVFLADGSVQHVEGNVLDTPNSRHIFLRDGLIHHLIVSFPIAGPTGIPEN